MIRRAYGIFNSGTWLIGINGTPAINPPNTASYSISTDQLFPNFLLKDGFPEGALNLTVDQINRSSRNTPASTVMSPTSTLPITALLQNWSAGFQAA